MKQKTDYKKVEKVIYNNNANSFVKKVIRKNMSKEDVDLIKRSSFSEEEYLEGVQYQILRTLSNVYNLYPRKLKKKMGYKDIYEWMLSCGGDFILKDNLTIYYIDGEAFYKYLNNNTNNENIIIALQYIKKSSYIEKDELQKISKLIDNFSTNKKMAIELY